MPAKNVNLKIIIVALFSFSLFQIFPFSVNPTRCYLSSNYYLTNEFSESKDYLDGIPYYYVFDKRSDDVSGVFEGLIKGIGIRKDNLYVRVKKSYGEGIENYVLNLKTGDISSCIQMPSMERPDFFFHSRIKMNLILGWGYWCLVFCTILILKFFRKKVAPQTV